MSVVDAAARGLEARAAGRPKANSAPAVETSGLVKRFGATTALAGLDLTVSAGSIFALLGPNGAGKTTAVRILAALLRPDAGTASVLGHDLARNADAVRARISLTGQLTSVDVDLTGHENLVLLGRLLGLSRHDAKRRATQLLGAFGLSEAAGRLVKTYSGGMHRRLDIAASLVIPPDLLFLDEPTTGLDPHSRYQTWELVRALAAGGATVVLTTQYLDEADQLADRIAVIDHGTVIAEGTSGELKASTGRTILRVRLQDPGRCPEAEQLLTRALQVPVRPEPDPSALSAAVIQPERAARALAELTRTGIAVTQFALDQPSLDEVFLALTGRSGRDETIEEDTA